MDFISLMWMCSRSQDQPHLYKRDFFWFFMCKHCFIRRPSNSTVSEDAGIELRAVATCQSEARTNHSARSLPPNSAEGVFRFNKFIGKISVMNFGIRLKREAFNLLATAHSFLHKRFFRFLFSILTQINGSAFSTQCMYFYLN
jgi:hypothetical protein